MTRKWRLWLMSEKIFLMTIIEICVLAVCHVNPIVLPVDRKCPD